MSYLAEFIALSSVFIIFGGVTSFYIKKNQKSFVLKSPSNIAMIRILYMYREVMLESEPVKKMKKFDLFESTLLEFIDKYEEEMSNEEAVMTSEKVKYIREFKKIGE